MHLLRIVASCVAAGSLAGCHRSPSTTAAPNRLAERTIFTDSLLHAERCLPVKAGEDWHRVCTPLDQSVRPVQLKPPQRP